jgi:hypothetical protein
MERTIATIVREVDFRALGQKIRHAASNAARLVEAPGNAAGALCQIAAEIEASGPLPAGRAVGIADALRDHADPHVSVMDQPGLCLGIGVTAAG